MAKATKDVPVVDEAPAPIAEAPATGTTLMTPEAVAQQALAELDDLAFADAADRQQVDRTDLATPFIRLLQDNSPEVKERMDSHIEGCKPGMYYHTVLKEAFDTLIVLPLYFQKTLVEWRPRPPKGLGGFVAEYPYSDEKYREATRIEDDLGRKRDVLPNGNELVITVTYYLLAYDPVSSRWFEAVFPCSSTQIKHAKSWNTAMHSLPPIRSAITNEERAPQPYYYAWKLGTQVESKNGNAWFTMTVDRLDKVGALFGAGVYLRAKEISDTLRKGVKKIDLSKMATEEPTKGDAAEDDDPKQPF